MSEHEHTAEDEPGSNSTPDASGAQRVADLQAWLKTAEASGSATLHEFAVMLCTVRA